MNCPYCHTNLQHTEVKTNDDQSGTVHECFTCGGHWFPRWLANDISSNQANSLDSIIPNQTIHPPQFPRCPECSTRLSLIKHDSIPKGLHVWTCPEGHGNFFPKGELIQFKKAQEAKITYHELWGVPIKSIFAVLLPVFIVLIATAVIPLTLKQTQTSQETRTKASQPISTPLVTIPTPGSASISFTTTNSITSQLTLYQNGQVTSTLDVSTQSSTVHTITIPNLNPQFEYSFTITLDNNPESTTKHYQIKPVQK